MISPAPNPVKVRLCLGLEKPGPTGPFRSVIGALVDGRRSLGGASDMSLLFLLLSNTLLILLEKTEDIENEGGGRRFIRL